MEKACSWKETIVIYCGFGCFRLILFINSSKELSNLLHLDMLPHKNQRLTKVKEERKNTMFPLLKLLEPCLLFFGNSFKSFITYPITYFPQISADYKIGIHSFSQIWNSCNVRLCNSGKYVTQKLIRKWTKITKGTRTSKQIEIDLSKIKSISQFFP